MANGKHGDHPLTDILIHKMEVYGNDADEIIRKISELSSHAELSDWWQKEIGWNCDKATVLKKAKVKFDELVQRAKSGGWEMK
jgi:hypothetical protein